MIFNFKLFASFWHHRKIKIKTNTHRDQCILHFQCVGVLSNTTTTTTTQAASTIITLYQSLGFEFFFFLCAWIHSLSFHSFSHLFYAHTNTPSFRWWISFFTVINSNENDKKSSMISFASRTKFYAKFYAMLSHTMS